MKAVTAREKMSHSFCEEIEWRRLNVFVCISARSRHCILVAIFLNDFTLSASHSLHVGRFGSVSLVLDGYCMLMFASPQSQFPVHNRVG